MRQFKTEKRISKFHSVAAMRQPYLSVIIENIHDPHNVSAIFRTCDAVGVPKVSLIYNIEKFPKIGKKSSASAFKWVEREKFSTVSECYSSLRSKGFRILASSFAEDSKSIYDLNLSEKTALVFGNEHRGLSEEASAGADERFIIPMFGMVQSLNVSVAAAVALYEAARQRMVSGSYSGNQFTEEEINELIEEWSKK